MTTENRNYNVPEEGEEDWHIPVNENWEDIDSDVQAALDQGGLQVTNTDLTTVAGGTVGVSQATDDGTNTPSGHAELCLWVDRDGAGDTAWQIVGTETYIEVTE